MFFINFMQNLILLILVAKNSLPGISLNDENLFETLPAALILFYKNMKRSSLTVNS